MTLIRDEDKKTIREEFAEKLVAPVRLVLFTQEIECQFCAETRQIVEEVAALSDKITAEIYNFVTDKDQAEAYGIDKIPAIAIIGAQDYGIRFYGIPSGYEFSSLFEDIIDVSRGESGLLEPTKKALAHLKEPVHIQVFVTPTCPYCPMAVRLAHRLASMNGASPGSSWMMALLLHTARARHLRHIRHAASSTCGMAVT